MQTPVGMSLVESLLASEAVADATALAKVFRRHPRRMARKLAMTVIHLLGPVTYPISLTVLAKQLGGKITRVPVAFADGSLTKYDNGYIIQVNASVPPCRQRFSVAHELGHLVLDQINQELQKGVTNPPSIFRGPMTDGRRAEELFCNWFSAYLLIPPDISAELADWAGVSIERLAEKARSLKVCLDVLIWHTLEQTNPKGCALRFRIKPQSNGLTQQADFEKFDLILTQTFGFKPNERLDLGTEFVVPGGTAFFQAVADIYPRIVRGDCVAEVFFPALEVNFGELAGKRPTLLKAIRETVWLILFPKHGVDLDAIPIKRTYISELQKPLQMTLFERSHSHSNGVTSPGEERILSKAFIPVPLPFE